MVYDQMHNTIVAIVHNRAAVNDIVARQIATDVLSELPKAAYGANHGSLIAELVATREALAKSKPIPSVMTVPDGPICVVCGGLIETGREHHSRCNDCDDLDIHSPA